VNISCALAIERPLEKRLVGVCDHFARLLVAFLRSRGKPARARFGFGAYFNPPQFEEHIVVEYWDAAQNRWKLADPQFDDVWRKQLKINHDILDVPRTQFLTAADAWRRCRVKKADPTKFGIFVGEQRGYWYIAGELVRDMASLNKMEMLPWDAARSVQRLAPTTGTRLTTRSCGWARYPFHGQRVGFGIRDIRTCALFCALAISRRGS